MWDIIYLWCPVVCRFWVDAGSCLPLGYLTYLFPEEASAATDATTAGSMARVSTGDSTIRMLKILRLVRLSKMLRLARMKRLLRKYSAHINMQIYVSIGFTLFVIFFMVHSLACIWYTIGIDTQTFSITILQYSTQRAPDGGHDCDCPIHFTDGLGHGMLILTDRTDGAGSGKTVNGWVTEIMDPASGLWDPYSTRLSTRYISSMYLVLNALENGTTDSERLFAVFAEFCRYGHALYCVHSTVARIPKRPTAH
jgi:hypothetical protein